jgi:catechol 2,3-dioxygenase-like lactoylglutathione lyase family enzyme
MEVIARPAYNHEERHRPRTNRFGLTSCDHFGLPARDPELAGAFYEAILGGVEFFRAGYSDEDRAKGKNKHIFYHVGPVLVELVEQEDRRGYPDVTNPVGANMNPHWAFETTPAGLAAFAKHLEREGVPYAGPRTHGSDISAVSVYFRDIDGNNLEVTTWQQVPDGFVPPRAKGERLAEWDKLQHNWRPH